MFAVTVMSAGLFLAQASVPQAAAPPGETPQEASAESAFRVEPGTKIPLSLMNTVSTKNAAEGDRVYLESIFPIIVNGQIVIPVGSNVAGTVTTVKRAGKVKGRAELFVRFDTLILPNGVMRDFRSRMSNMDGSAGGNLDRSEGKVEGEGNKGGDARAIGDAALSGAVLGGIAGSAMGNTGMGMGIGTGAAAAAAMIGILATRGPDAVLPKGTTVEMLLDRQLAFSDSEVDFSKVTPQQRRPIITEPAASRPSERPGWRAGRPF